MKKILIGSLLIFTAFVYAQEEDESLEERPAFNREAEEQAKAFMKHSAMLVGYERDVKNLKEELNILIEAKRAGREKVKLGEQEVEVLDAIVDRHEKLTQAHNKYENERKLLRYRYPAKNNQIERRYLPLRPPSLEQVEREVGLNGQLTEIREKTDRKYASFRKDAEKELDELSPKKTYIRPDVDKDTHESPGKRLKLSQ